MRPFRLALILVAGALALASPERLPAGWGAGCLPAVAGPAFAQFMPQVDDAYRWRPVDDEEIALYRGGVQLGNYRFTDDAYYARLPGGGFASEASQPPIAPPAGRAKKKCACSAACGCKKNKCACTSAKRCNPECKCVKVIGGAEGQSCGPGCIVKDGVPNYGVRTGQISPVERYTIMGREVTKEAVEEALEEAAPATGGAPDVPDDSAKLSLTIIGSEAERKAALDGLAAPGLATFREHVLVQDYAPDSPMLKPGFVTSGHPTIYLEMPDGAVLARVDDYQGPETWEAVRKKDPAYDSSKDPDPTKPKPKPSPTPVPDDGSGISAGVVVAVLAGVAFLGLFALGCLIGFVLLVRALVRRRAA